MNLTQVIGILAGVTASILFLPQAVKTIKTKDTKSLSLVMYILNTFNNLLWLTYGLLTWDPAILIAQICLFPLGLIILFYKLKYG